MKNRELYIVLRDNLGTPLEEFALHESRGPLRMRIHADDGTFIYHRPFITEADLIVPACAEEFGLIGKPHGVLSYDPSNANVVEYNPFYNPRGNLQFTIRAQRVRTFRHPFAGEIRDVENKIFGIATLDMGDPRVVSYAIPVGYHSIRLSRVPEKTMLERRMGS